MTSFQCPECGSIKIKSQLYVSTVPDPNDPWSSVLQQLECGGCNSYIPAHLGERWDNISYEDAKKEWIKIYKRK